MHWPMNRCGQVTRPTNVSDCFAFYGIFSSFDNAGNTYLISRFSNLFLGSPVKGYNLMSMKHCIHTYRNYNDFVE